MSTKSPAIVGRTHPDVSIKMSSSHKKPQGEVCPIMTMSLGTPDECIKEHCALWIEYTGECAFKCIAQDLINVQKRLSRVNER